MDAVAVAVAFAVAYIELLISNFRNPWLVASTSWLTLSVRCLIPGFDSPAEPRLRQTQKTTTATAINTTTATTAAITGTADDEPPELALDITGETVGVVEGGEEGFVVGRKVGDEVGLLDGIDDGWFVGSEVGKAVGVVVGDRVGLLVFVGNIDGDVVGD